MHVIEYPSPAAKRGFVGIPNAAIRVEQADDGRWMWGWSFTTSGGGEGFHPFPKWGRFAETEREAIEAGAAEFIDRLSKRTWADSPQAAALKGWAESIVAPVQGGLFA